MSSRNPKILICLVIYLVATTTVTAVAAEEESKFCYDDSNCAPNSWPGVCTTGQHQSPIELPSGLKPSGLSTLRMVKAYRGNYFRLKNDGHLTFYVDFGGEGPSSEEFLFPDALSPNDKKHRRPYKFAGAHFHWGKTDESSGGGSEHCLDTGCANLELHLVHYSANYTSVDEALYSGDENALAVLGVMATVTSSNSQGHSSIAPIIKNLGSVAATSHDYQTVNEPLDLTQFIVTAENNHLVDVYSYKGSLTTPPCNEQVNWFVVKKPQTVHSSDLEAFRTKIQDSEGKAVTENHRPLMPLNDRQILLSRVIPSR